MKKLLVSTLAAVSMFAAMSTAVHAAAATGTFNVNISLTSACTVDTAATAATFPTYTSQQAGPVTFATGFNVTCTNALPITSITLDGGAGPTWAYTDAAVNLAYTITMGAVPVSGTGVPQAVTLAGSMLGGQVGTCNAASCSNAASANKTRTVTITY